MVTPYKIEKKELTKKVHVKFKFLSRTIIDGDVRRVETCL